MPTTAAGTRVATFPAIDSIDSAIWPGVVLLVFAITAVLVDVMIILSTRFRMVDLPNLRSAHSLPTARGGGVAIVLTVCFSAMAAVVRWPSLGLRVVLGAMIPGLVIGIVGLVDDIRPLRPLLRLFIQIGIAALMTWVLDPIDRITMPVVGTVELGVFAWPLTIIWIVGMINAYNFIDGADGMAGLAGVVVGASMALVALETRSLPATIMASFCGAAAGGFLVFNWQPARIFMGDAGSSFLGLFFAAIPLLFSAPRADAFVPAILCLWPYVYDTLLSVTRRLYHGQNPFQPHREFLFHRLIRSGYSHSAVAAIYGALSALGGLLGYVMVFPDCPQITRDGAVFLVVVLSMILTFMIERRCRQVGLPSAGASYSPAS